MGAWVNWKIKFLVSLGSVEVVVELCVPESLSVRPGHFSCGLLLWVANYAPERFSLKCLSSPTRCNYYVSHSYWRLCFVAYVHMYMHSHVHSTM